MKKIGITIVIIASLVVAPVVARAQVCEVMIIVSALVTSATKKRELTEKEAMTCGIPILPEDDKKAGKKAKKKKVSAAQ